MCYILYSDCIKEHLFALKSQSVNSCRLLIISKTSLEKVQKRPTRWACAKWNSSTFSRNAAMSFDGPPYTTTKKFAHATSNLRLCTTWIAIDIPTYYSHPCSNINKNSLECECKNSRINSYRHSCIFYIRTPFLWNTLRYS